MAEAPGPPSMLRFGAFQFDPACGELRKHGMKLKLQGQPIEILAVLLERRREVVTREELQKRLWPADTFVDFEHSLNAAVKRLRDALDDSAETPRYIETLSRRGYRFIAPVQRVHGNAAPKREAPLRRHRSWLALGGVTAVILISAIGVWRFSHAHKTVLNFAARDWVLISSFENRTGDPLLDGTLEYALERELSNSQFVNVVSRERVGDALQLMRRPLDTKIDAAVGREVCLRDGGIRVLLTGRVEKLGTTYLLSAQLVDPTSGVALASLSEEDSAGSQLAAAVRRLSNRVRERLGEKKTLVQQSEKRLEKVTTPSLHALQLYTQANNLMRFDDNQAAAAELLKRAVAEDPGFASAHLLLGWTYHNREMGIQARPEFQRALDLADTTPDRERFFIVGSYYSTVGKDQQKAIDAYEALLRLYPDHFWANRNLEGLYGDHFRDGEYGRFLQRMAELRPDDPEASAGVFWEKGFLERDLEGARPYLQRASALLAAQGEKADPGLATWLKLLPAYEFWLNGNVAQAHAVVTEVERTNKAIRPGQLAGFYLTFGQLREAEQHYRHDPDAASEGSYVIEFMRGTWSSAEKQSKSHDGDLLRSFAAFLRVRPNLAKKIRPDLVKKLEVDVASPALRENQLNPLDKLDMGIISLGRGDTARGISLLEQGLKAAQSRPIGDFFIGAESLAETYRNKGKIDDALRILQLASTKKTLTYDFPDRGILAAVWMRNEFHLADLYRKIGPVAEAEQIENELRKMLVYADADYPMLIELQRRQQTVSH